VILAAARVGTFLEWLLLIAVILERSAMKIIRKYAGVVERLYGYPVRYWYLSPGAAPVWTAQGGRAGKTGK
jgi:hypothetical protein